MNMATLISGSALSLGIVLVLAVGAKIRDVPAFELALMRMLPLRNRRHVNSRMAARTLLAIELVTGVLLLVFPEVPAVGLLAAGLFACFFAATLRAARINAPCGCFGDRDPATAASITRSGMLLVVGAFLAISDVINWHWSTGGGAPGISLPFAVGLLGIIWAARVVSRVLAATRSARSVPSGSQPVPSGSQPVGVAAGLSRLEFVRAAAGLALAALGLAVVIGPAGAHASVQPRSCFDLFNLCTGCCKRNGYPYDQCNQSCIDCYVSCEDGGAGALCLDPYGCWAYAQSQ